MKKAIIYQKEECVIIRNINLSGKVFAFFVALDSKKIIYLKENIYDNNVTYASLDKMIQCIKDYQVPSIFNTKILLDTFTNTINYRIRHNIINDSDEIIEMIIKFEKIIKDPYIVKMTSSSCIQIFSKEAMYQVTNTIKKIENKVNKPTFADLLVSHTAKSNDVFTSQNWLKHGSRDNKQLLYESLNKSNTEHKKTCIDFLFNNKLLNIYMIIMIVAVVTFAGSLNIITKWIKETSSYDKEMEQLEEEGLAVDPDIYVVSNANSNTKSNTKSNKVSNTISNKTSNNTNLKTYNNYPNITLLQPNFSNLLKKNSDTVAWLYINNTNISYPVVYSNTGTYYHTHDFNRKSTTSGWIYADYRTDFKSYKSNNIIYGHGVSTRFGNLEKLFNKSWYSNKDNHYIKLSTPREDTLWRIVSVYTAKDSKYPVSVYFEDEKMFKKWALSEVKKSKVKFDYSYKKTDKFLTLKTCRGTGSKRIFVHAVLVASQKK